MAFFVRICVLLGLLEVVHRYTPLLIVEKVIYSLFIISLISFIWELCTILYFKVLYYSRLLSFKLGPNFNLVIISLFTLLSINLFILIDNNFILIFENIVSMRRSNIHDILNSSGVSQEISVNNSGGGSGGSSGGGSGGDPAGGRPPTPSNSSEPTTVAEQHRGSGFTLINGTYIVDDPSNVANRGFDVQSSSQPFCKNLANAVAHAKTNDSLSANPSWYRISHKFEEGSQNFIRDFMHSYDPNKTNPKLWQLGYTPLNQLSNLK